MTCLDYSLLDQYTRKTRRREKISLSFVESSCQLSEGIHRLSIVQRICATNLRVISLIDHRELDAFSAGAVVVVVGADHH
jgi:hypothetical protein